MLKSIAEKLKASDGILILTHIKPDGDTLGSAAALAEAMGLLGKRAWIFCDDEITPKYRFLVDGRAPLTAGARPGLVVAVDIASPGLLGSEGARYAERCGIVIDHHTTNTLQAELKLVDPTRSATGEIVYDLLEHLGVEPNRAIAEAIYTAIATDTGCFSYANTNARSHIIAGELIARGFDFSEINKRIFGTKSLPRFKIEAELMKGMEFYDGGTVAIGLITLDALYRAGAGEDDVDNIAAMPRQIEGVHAGIILRQVGPDEYKVSVRTDASVDAARVCEAFGGGGHVRAAGCTVFGRPEEIKKALLAEIARQRGANPA